MPDLMDAEVYFRSLENLTYRERRTILAKQKPKIAAFHYKFLSLDPHSDKSVDRLRDIAVRSRLYLNAPTDFNDPFDAAAQLVVNGTRLEIKERLRRLVKTHYGYASKTDKEQRIREFQRKSLEELIQMAQNAYNETRQGLGIHCFGGDPLNILMWSHYSAQHAGFCIQFDTARDPRTFAQALCVEYGNSYPIINWLQSFEKDSAAAVRKKHDKWKYEKESRIVELNAAHTYLDFRPSALRAIIFGCRNNETAESKLRELLQERQSQHLPPVTLYRAHQHATKYKLLLRKIA